MAPSQTIPPRQVAFEILRAVLRSKRPFDESFEQHQGLASLEDRDRAFVRLLVATALRRRGQIDDLIGQCLDRPLALKAEPIRDVMRLGIAQLLFLETPPHAAVGTSVELAQEMGLGPLKGLANAVLRRVSREGKAMLARQDAARINTPTWLWDSWKSAYGEAACRAIAQAHQAEPPLDISVKSDPQGWAAKLDAQLLPTGSLRRAAAHVPTLPGFAEGEWWVQDAAAALPVGLLGDLRGQNVADLCAAPGGKTMQLAAAGARVTAVDRSAKRLERVSENMQRLGLDASITAADAAEWQPPTPFDSVLLDAPCSATGTIRRHPDVPWLKTPQDVAKLLTTQDKLLRAAVQMLKPGGTLVYCVCSLQPEEGPGRIATLLASGAPVRRVPIRPEEIGGLADLITPEGDLRSLPCHLAELGGMDGFFAVRLEKTA